MDKYQILQNSTVGLLIFLLLLFIWLGLRSGQAQAQSRAVVRNTEAIAQGVNYFYNDYDRFPSGQEFETFQLMDSYFEPWPSHQFASKGCPQSIRYESLGFAQYKLQICLPAGYKGLPKGFSEFTVSK